MTMRQDEKWERDLIAKTLESVAKQVRSGVLNTVDVQWQKGGTLTFTQAVKPPKPAEHVTIEAGTLDKGGVNGPPTARPAMRPQPQPSASHKSMMFCEHANECPQTCPCPVDCACKDGMCKDRPVSQAAYERARI
jgi:hypothetical protein